MQPRANAGWRASLVVAVSFMLFVCLLPLEAAANRKCTQAEQADADKWLFLNARDTQLALEKHLPSGVPARAAPSTDERLLVHGDYIIGYHDDLRIPLWIAYRLDAVGLNQVDGRIECFRADKRLPASAASTPGDYDEPKFDQGHLAPSEDMSHNIRRNVNSFIMSNMAPQYANFNRVIWRRLEGQGQKWSKMFRTVYIISGSIFDADNDAKPDVPTSVDRMQSKNGNRRVAIPTHFFKIIVRECKDGELESLTFLLPHEDKSRKGDDGKELLESSVANISSIEAVTGLTLFPSGSPKYERTTTWPLPTKKSAKHPQACGA